MSEFPHNTRGGGLDKWNGLKEFFEVLTLNTDTDSVYDYYPPMAILMSNPSI